jgi:hypothetical protein
MRETPAPLERLYAACCAEPSDINEHLDVIRKYAAECEHVTEFGLRGGRGSTVAILAAQPSTFITWDINPFSIVSQAVADLVMVNQGGRTKFQPRVGDTLEILPEPTDMLFIDTLHTAKQLWSELVRHADPMANNVRKYLVFHDTATFGYTDEVGEGPGLRLAIRKFQKEHAFPLWRLIEDRQNNNGLVVLVNERSLVQPVAP